MKRLGTFVMMLLSLPMFGCDENSSPGNVHTMLVVAGQAQSAPINSVLPESIVVQCMTPHDGPGGNRPVTWVVQSGDGSVSPTCTVTDTAGFATVAWTLGQYPGIQELRAVWLESADSTCQGGYEIARVFVVATAVAVCAGTGGTAHSGFITSSETWTAAGSPHRAIDNVLIVDGATLTIEAGAHVCLSDYGGLSTSNSSRIVALGTVTNPIRFEVLEGAGDFLISLGDGVGAAVTSRFSNVRVINGSIIANAGYPVEIESTLVRGGDVVLAAGGSRFSHSSLHEGRLMAGSNDAGLIEIEATVSGSQTEGITAGQGATIYRSEVVGNLGPGVNVLHPSTASVMQCNLVDNGGPGVLNGLPGTADARDNWWGDPSGPDGPNGDGVEGDVNIAGFLSSPVVLGYRPPP